MNVGRITFRGPSMDHDIALDGLAIGTGWWPCERPGGGPRWTAGDAAFAVPAEGGVLDITLAGTARYAVATRPSERQVAQGASPLGGPSWFRGAPRTLRR